MNKFYQAWLSVAQSAAVKAGLRWRPEYCRVTGSINKSERWNLTRLIGLIPPPTIWLSDFGHINKDLTILGNMDAASRLQSSRVMSVDWQDFYQAVLIHELLLKRNKIVHAVSNVGRVVRLLSACAEATPPWELSATIAQLGYNAALRVGASGKIALNLRMVVRQLFDREHLANKAPLHQYCGPFPDQISQAAQTNVVRQQSREGSNYNVHAIRAELADRKSADRLPEARAFWELVRIIFTERPRTFTDRLRFAALRIQIVTGLRIGENMLIPRDWARWRSYLDELGRPAGLSGGVSRSLKLRYFAEKVDDDTGRGTRLVECFQDVPRLFEALVIETLSDIERCTAPLRRRLEEQTTAGRLLPEYRPEDLVPAPELYTRISGSARFSGKLVPEELKARYIADHGCEVLQEIRLDQEAAVAQFGLRPVYKYWHYMLKSSGLVPRSSKGLPIPLKSDSECIFFRVSEVEEVVAATMPSKLSDTAPMIGPDRRPFYPYELLFLHPPRSLIEGRDGGIVDIERYFSVGRLPASDIQLQLSNKVNGLFARYGETPEDRAHSLNTHAMRHLQNTELFRLGVADTAITKRFGRTSPIQSATYDHRSLAESLAAVDIPDGARAILPERTHDTLKMIMAGKIRGPIINEFLSVQREHGDDDAFAYLAAEADGLHATPYGFCLSSFTVDPCPKHLECFNGCRHLGRTDNPEETRSLEKLRERTEATLAAAVRSNAVTAGHRNQVAHAKRLLEGIDRILATPAGEAPFPNGLDLSELSRRSPSIVDTPRVPKT